MKGFIVFVLVFSVVTVFAEEITYHDANLKMSVPDDWYGEISDDDGSFFAESPDGEMFIILAGIGKSELIEADRSSIVHKAIMEWDFDFEVYDEQETELNGIPLSVVFGVGVIEGIEAGGSIMLLEVENSDYMGLLIVLGTEEGWENYEEEITLLFMSLNPIV